MKLENLNDEIMVISALRYCLGRRTYVVNSCCEFIRQVWDQIPKSQQNVIARDILEAFYEGNVGSKCDADEWRNLIRWCYERFDDDQKKWVRQSLAHKEEYIINDVLTDDNIGCTVMFKSDSKTYKGKILARSDSHGLFYKVRSYQIDVSDRCFEPEELEFV